MFIRKLKTNIKLNLMRKITTLFLFGTLLAFAQTANSQCTPDPQYTNPGFYPASLPSVCENVTYDETITIVLQDEYTFAGTFTLTMDSVIFTSIDNLPPGLNYDCADAQCKVINPGGSNIVPTCVRFFGIPTTAGLYTATVNYRAFSGGLFIDQSENVDITVNNAGSVQCLATGLFDQQNQTASYSAYPNPSFDGVVNFSETINNISVFNAMGVIVLESTQAASISLDGQPAGIYTILAAEGTTRVEVK